MKTLHVKVRQDSWAWLDAASKEVNLVWNYVNELCTRAARPYYGPGKWLSGFDVDKLLAGTSRELECLPQLTVARIAIEHADKRRQAGRTRLSWRNSGGARKSFGWVPFRRGQISFKRGAIAKAIGIDLGLKDIAVTSEGETLAAGRWYRGVEQRVAQAQRRGHKRQAKRFQRDAANRRKDALHKFSTAMVEQYGAIYIGDVSSTKLAKTRMAKSVLDSGWGMLRTMLQYKGHQAGRIVEVVNERFTTQACSACGSITGPKGRAQLVVREWACVACGTTHSRDTNAARNILALGLQGPSAGTSNGKRRPRRTPVRPATSRREPTERMMCRPLTTHKES